ncbi:type VI secretion system tube protein Hcp [Paucibacter sp. R3-3]|uniref:Type VI secretion system tube protein Hcp n=1 Tax=Roseateles agri TaxID=3098619 RepID=A0ABU5DDC3_9BURK|nr:type VI secretion system tube protein Hcp [Paucibacter sp. R3-3]MDY0743279.1 type VI secretion system tube protein Hcp [Paucibacter sp. R3-3]
MAKVDYFLKITGVDGESTDDKHKGEIELISYSLGGTNAGSFQSGGGGGSGKVALHDFSFVKKVDKSSAKLFAAMCSGEHYDTATLVCRRAGKEQQEFLTVVLSKVIVSSLTHLGAEGAETIPSDSVTLNFGKIEFKYKEQKPDGSLGGEIIGGWDQTTNKVV